MYNLVVVTIYNKYLTCFRSSSPTDFERLLKILLGQVKMSMSFTWDQDVSKCKHNSENLVKYEELWRFKIGIRWCLHSLKVNSKLKFQLVNNFKSIQPLICCLWKGLKCSQLECRRYLQITILNHQYRNIRFPIAKMTIIIATLIIKFLFFPVSTSHSSSN